MAVSFNIRKRYNFSTKVPSVLGGEYRNMLVESIMTATEAAKFMDVMTQHEQLKDLAALTMDVNTCTFIKFKTIEGEMVIMALEYINPDSIVEVQSTNVRVELYNANTEDVLILDARMKELGYKNFKITTFE